MALRVAGSVTAIGSLIVGGVANEVLFLDAAGKLAQSSDLVFNSTTAIHTIGGTTAGAGLVVTGGTITADIQALSITQTRNNAAVTFGGALKVAVTDTAAANGSLAFQVNVGASQVFGISSKTAAGVSIVHGTGTVLYVGTSANAATIGIVSNGINFYNSAFSAINAIYTVDGSSASQFRQNSSGILGWSASADGSANVATAITRISDGLLAIGTGTVGSSAGRLKLTSAIAAGVAVGSLNASPTTGEIQSVTDALAPAAGSAVAAGGAAKALVWYNGAQWTVIGT